MRQRFQLILLVWLSVFAVWITPVPAQDSSAAEDQSFIESWLQDTLSSAGRDITITGFAGALSSTATLESLTIADDQGIWFTLRDVRFEWSRLALLRRRLEVRELSIGYIELLRVPQTEAQPEPEDAQATEFALPELPVNIEVQNVNATEIRLGEDVMGRETALTFEGALLLAGGEARTDIDIRVLESSDTLSLGAGFSNETRILAIDLALSEAAGGMLTSLAGIPGAPQIEFTVQGEAPLSEYEALIALSSNGERRFGGTVNIARVEESDGSFSFGAALDGDLRPLLSEEMHPFFGSQTTFGLQGQTRDAGGVVIAELNLSTDALLLNGSLSVDGEGWPERFDLTGEIDADDPIRLPAGGGDPVTIERLTLSARHDITQSEDWDADFTVEGFENLGFQIGQANLSGNGTLSRGTTKEVTAALELMASDLVAAEPALNTAIGSAITASADLAWQNERPIVLSSLEVEAGDASLQAQGELGAVPEGLPVSGEASIRAADLSRFSEIAGRDLAGLAEAQISGDGKLLGGAFDIALEAGTTDLALSEPRLDPLLTGTSTLQLAAQRTTEGTEIEEFTLSNDHVSADISGQLNAEAGTLQVDAELSEIALVEPRLSGPVTLSSGVDWAAGDVVTLTELDVRGAGAVLQGTGTLDPETATLPVSGRFTLDSPDLSTLASLAGRDIAGQIRAVLEGSGEVQGDVFDIALNAQANDLQAGIPQLDPLLAGRGTLDVRATRDGPAFGLETLDLNFPKILASGGGQLGDAGGDASLTARITELEGVADGLSGPATLDAQGVWERGGRLTLTSLKAEAVGSQIDASGAIWPEDEDLPVEGRLTLRAPDLSRFSALIGRSLAGDLALEAEGSGAVRAARLDAELDLDAKGFRSGQREIDALLGGDVTLDASASVGDGPPDIRVLNLQAPGVQVEASGGGPGAPISLAARLANLGVFLPGFNGAVTADGSIAILDAEGRDLDVNIAATGPNGIEARIEGQIEEFGQTVALSLTGGAPAGVANRFLEPRAIQGSTAFNLRVQGPPGLEAISGSATLSDARLSLPTLNSSLTDLSGNVEINGGTAQIALGGAAGGGGRFDVTGPVTLSPPFNAGINVALQQLGVSDPSLYNTILTGDIGVNGPLTNGPEVAGTINMGLTELRIPSGGAGPGAIPDIDHIRESPPVRETRRRAGLIRDETGGRGGVPPRLDITVNAPNQVFLRGRGLDSELGGTIRVFGPTDSISASGFFELIRGRLDILGRRLDLTEGLIDLRGSLDPYLRIVAETEADDVDISVIIEGLASAPEVSFTSSPDLPQEEVAARLIFGKGIDDLSALQAARLVSAAAALSGRGGGGLFGSVRSGLGLSDLDVATTDDGGTEVRAGAYISDNLYSEFVVDSDGNEEINLNLDVSDSLTVKGIAASDGNTGLGFFFERDY